MCTGRMARVRSVMRLSIEAGSMVSVARSEEHTSELQSQSNLVCRLLLEKKNTAHRQRAKSHMSSIMLGHINIIIPVAEYPILLDISFTTSQTTVIAIIVTQCIGITLKRH